MSSVVQKIRRSLRSSQRQPRPLVGSISGDQHLVERQTQMRKKPSARIQRLATVFRESFSRKNNHPEISTRGHFIRKALTEQEEKTAEENVATPQQESLDREHTSETDATEFYTCHGECDDDGDEEEPIIIKEVSPHLEDKNKEMEAKKVSIVSDEERQLAYSEYGHRGFPEKKDFVEMVKNDPLCTVTVEAIESLPWMEGDFMVNGARMV
mmetsp:Transcript_3324/g.6946  ORF Transcript_3324/g.6946 Transcript_3324/m.6946 type:complete len:211 (-) Transcript_3324:51-683(-)|eukprot:CAMPEP_0168778962 /NCGR_PEP_ID=MMETSP0725-20121227/7349_1 /TAXON_ID=265536 /ORGANISM="Amphiprora sp., Strain CCMP467" /LENGTH=210 /DNA_ID=CAMNT_0008828741 /DNA_START=111 /DNA_END=743 /DNA_ORIENTATION=-